MKNIKILGTGCTKCKATASLIEHVAQALKIEIKMYKIEDPAQIMAYGIMSTPAVIMDKKLMHKGSVPLREDVEAWLSDE